MDCLVLNAIAAACVGGDTKERASFYVERELDPEDVQIEVDGVGALTLPLDRQVLQKLIAVSSKAKFGLREKTVLDENVRNTQEIPADTVRVTIKESAIAKMLTKMRNALGLASDATIVPHLHNMLIYGPGQFFQKHQDSEKLDGMIATLVLVLPSAHIGGDLLIEHNGKKHAFSSENVDCTKIRCVAFYADCHHEVKKVTQGHRVALTYNLVLKLAKESIETHVNQPLKEALESYFPESEEPIEPPTKLAYFLDHSYTEHSLRWNMLKGADRANAAAFRAVAHELGLVTHLALVKIHETWSTEYGKKNPKLEDLIDSETELSYWIDGNNENVPFRECWVREHEICWKKGTDKSDLFDSEYTGYQGNYGNTFDFWYRRAAVVLWRRIDDVSMRFDLGYDSALTTLVALTKAPGNEKQVTEIIKASGESLCRRDHRHLVDKDREGNDFVIFANLAGYLKDKGMAHSLLSHFTWNVLDTDMVEEQFIKLQELYGINWCTDLLRSWGAKAVMPPITPFILPFLEHGGDHRLAGFLLEVQSAAVITEDESLNAWDRGALRDGLSARFTAVADVLNASFAVPVSPVLGRVIQHLLTRPELYPEPLLTEFFCEFHPHIPQSHKAFYRPLRDGLAKNIRTELALGQRIPGDWSIDVDWRCRCEHCEKTLAFLRSKEERKLVWPLAKEGREHVKRECAYREVPVSMMELRGAPYKLVLEKMDTLHRAASKRFATLSALLPALEAVEL